MKTILGSNIPLDIRGVLYLCEYRREVPALKIIRIIMFVNPDNALEAYANTPNPESQLAIGKTREQLNEELEKLHKNMRDTKWLKQLGDAL